MRAFNDEIFIIKDLGLFLMRLLRPILGGKF